MTATDWIEVFRARAYDIYVVGSMDGRFWMNVGIVWTVEHERCTGEDEEYQCLPGIRDWMRCDATMFGFWFLAYDTLLSFDLLWIL